MVIETLIFKEIGLLPELFLGISLIYLTLHGTFLSVSKNYPLLQISNLYLSVLVLSMVCFLLCIYSVLVVFMFYLFFLKT